MLLAVAVSRAAVVSAFPPSVMTALVTTGPNAPPGKQREEITVKMNPTIDSIHLVLVSRSILVSTTSPRESASVPDIPQLWRTDDQAPNSRSRACPGRLD